jgi:hypothetical protein
VNNFTSPTSVGEPLEPVKLYIDEPVKNPILSDNFTLIRTPIVNYAPNLYPWTSAPTDPQYMCSKKNSDIFGNKFSMKCEISNGVLKVNGTTIAKQNNNDYENYLSHCYDKALCINEDNQKKINNLQLKHDGADERHGDINIYYNRELLKSYNLGIGIVGVGIMIYFFYK